MEQFLDAFLAKTKADLKILLLVPPPMESGAWVSNHRMLDEPRWLAGCNKITARQLGIAFADART